MQVKIEFKNHYKLVDLCRTCGCAPCQILALNKARTEEELRGREIIVPISTASFVQSCGKIPS